MIDKFKIPKNYSKYFKIGCYVILAITIIIGIFTRFYPIISYTEFKFDQARDAFVVMQMREGIMPLEGPTSSIQKFTLPPYYYYLLYPITFFGTDPRLLAIPNALFSLLSIPLLFYVIYRYAKFKSENQSLFFAALASFVWSFLLADISLANIAWNPGPIPCFILIYLILIFKLDKLTDLKGKKLWLPIVLGIVITVLLSLHSITFLIIPVVTIGTWYWKLLETNFDLKKLKIYSITAITILLLLIPYLFSSKGILNWYLPNVISTLPHNTFIIAGFIIGAIVFICLNIFLRKYISSPQFLKRIKKLTSITLFLIFCICLIFNFDSFTLFFQVVLNQIYIPTSQYWLLTILKYSVPAILVAFVFNFFKFNFIGGLYFFILTIFLFIAQVYDGFPYNYYASIIWTLPLFLLLQLFNSLPNQYKYLRWGLLAIYFCFCIVSFRINFHNLTNYIFNVKFGSQRLMNTTDLEEAFELIPEKACFNIPKETINDNVYEYIAKYRTKKEFEFSENGCESEEFLIHSKYIPEVGFRTVLNPIEADTNIEKFYEGEFYYILKRN